MVIGIKGFEAGFKLGLQAAAMSHPAAALGAALLDQKGGGGFGMSDLFSHGGAALEKTMQQFRAALMGIDERQMGSLDGSRHESAANAGFRADDNRSRLYAQNGLFDVDHRQVGLGNRIDAFGDRARAAGADHVAKPLSQLSAFLFGNASKTDGVDSGLTHQELQGLSRDIHKLLDSGALPPAMRGAVEQGVARLDRNLVENAAQPGVL